MEIERDLLEHLLNCLVIQKALHEKRLDERVKGQAVIDDVWRQGMALLQEYDHGTGPGQNR